VKNKIRFVIWNWIRLLPDLFTVWEELKRLQQEKAHKLSHSFQNVTPIDNGGRAKPSPPITREFNSQAQPAHAYKQQIKIRFAP
jgi:hypothetical protein